MTPAGPPVALGTVPDPSAAGGAAARSARAPGFSPGGPGLSGRVRDRGESPHTMPASAADGSAVLERGRRPRRPADPPAKSRPAAKSARSRPQRNPAADGAAAKRAAPEQDAAAAAGARTVLEEEPRARRSITEILGVWGLSVLVHVVAGLALTFIIIDSETRDQIFSILGEASDEPDDAPIFEAIEMPESLAEIEETTEVADVESETVAEAATEMPLDVNDLDPSLALDAADVGQAVTVKLSNATSGRSASAKAALVEKYGGNTASEKAVATGLKWIASQQRPDGSWDFREVGDEPEFDAAGESELADAPMAATASALLAFLGGGHTHRSRGPYKKTVEAGLNYLIAKSVTVPVNGVPVTDYRGGFKGQGMYVQGIVCIALAEAYGMTKHRDLRRAAEAGLRFIIAGQGPLGGWRYKPAFEVQKQIAERDPKILGDTSVVGWQLMALKSGQAANIKIPSSVFKQIDNFLDAAGHSDGAEYGYQPKQAYLLDPEKKTDGSGSVTSTRSAIGLLCRMYLGWDRDDDALERGVRKIAERGPDRDNAYHAYYATQVLHHWGGDLWEEWNAVQRDMLVSTQETAGELAGSWNPGRDHGARRGGRLWQTCLSVMTLEVYYRHLPMYERGDIQVEF